ncbi:bifunctional 2',3'-cyclic-nucleotide 2'-phosphodiesterase/3'-nucleotidase [Paenibacillus polymyxa]|uniref:bifunctional 2',3'-cyclic-nucleotide 2'-phosphodiesterase/3'-nucleotidase n=1 Tax=Paenibacillus TaxID=44249 RepID=UPI000F505DE5|nr:MULTISPECIES: bifunctional 2',3'-cyclic-nucleotide 2'-phosphodiesterase/3'-nucleotidase [Paenibacillus]KAF6652375.1 bifunctional 2',3'-cyclic-nucleotide 2'-phosphodiesterase/3'-nucleotidase [Paenibacillus sp. EKM301P]RPE10967.1 bifunctional 2',3'-cyclic-nucleotide 2'-phosphodiesterase/3'-nucleotidase [Paenibacillus polymyxa]UBS87699.1 bifunctional 2',3'-cyclic-nucleotide 2'-phosphodiesterase/3'-nucleotidase [Paenibacillus polymyxa]WHX36287.1 bifunctional 2',3'-cyclic-nucleotide 2'-phosphodie
MLFRKNWFKGFTAAVVACSLLVFSAAPSWAASNSRDSATVNLRIMETTDIHGALMNYDYYSDKETNEYGLIRTASLIQQARSETRNSMLFDNGDLLQGNPLDDYMARNKTFEKEGGVHPVYKMMNLMGYDAATVGNHEFNYGLDFLDKSLKGADFPYVNANVYVDKGGQATKNYFTPYQILDKTVTDEKGEEHTLRVGVIGLVTPQIMQWDEANLKDKVVTKDIVETAKKFIPQMKTEGADIIVVLAHTGYEDVPQTPMMENAVKYLSQVDGINAILFGHAHKSFPGPDFKDMKGVDLDRGTINGVPAVEASSWGKDLGIIDLSLEKKKDEWNVINSQSQVRPVVSTTNQSVQFTPEFKLIDAIKEEHQGTLDYVRQPVGTTTAPITSYFALVQDDPSIQIVTNAQKWYVQNHLKGTEYENLPVLSAGAPFKAGGRNGAEYYTNIPEGTIAIKNVSDLYVYPNTVHAVEVTGAEIQEWLEWSAGQFNRIDPSKTEEQSLINKDFPTYNFDVIDGVNYQIDVTQPARYDAKGTIIDSSAHRIKDLQYNGKAIDPAQKFIVATNNYRASSSKLANPDGKRIVMAAPDESRQVVVDYIRTNGTINPSADGNWSIAPFGQAKVTFESSPDAKDVLAGNQQISYLSSAADGFAKYSLKAGAKPSAATTSVKEAAAPAKATAKPAVKTTKPAAAKPAKTTKPKASK